MAIVGRPPCWNGVYGAWRLPSAHPLLAAPSLFHTLSLQTFYFATYFLCSTLQPLPCRNAFPCSAFPFFKTFAFATPFLGSTFLLQHLAKPFFALLYYLTVLVRR